ncbi:HdeD family acid-resistance protein [Verrucomicrobiota bacterium]
MSNENGLAQVGWGWFMALGIVLVLLGCLVIASPFLAAVALEVVIGWTLVVAGVVTVIHAFGSRNVGGFFLRSLNGVIAILVGGFVLTHILSAMIALSVILAVFLIIQGIFKLAVAIKLRGITNRGWLFFSGILGLGLGCLWIIWPLTAAWVVGLFVGIDMLFGGWAMIMLSVAIRKGGGTGLSIESSVAS